MAGAYREADVEKKTRFKQRKIVLKASLKQPKLRKIKNLNLFAEAK